MKCRAGPHSSVSTKWFSVSVFQVDGEGFENTLDASSLDFKVPPVSDFPGVTGPETRRKCLLFLGGRGRVFV